MKKQLLITAFIAATSAIQAQVGVNTESPKSSMDVRGKTDAGGISLPSDITGLQAPRLTRAELTSKGNSLYGTDQKGALVYITDISGGDALSQRVKITAIGYYYFDGTLWQSVSSGATTGINYFYAPSMVLPTVNANLPSYASFSGGTFTINLYSAYSNEYGLTDSGTVATRSSIKSATSTTLPVLGASALEYFVIYFDNTVFDPNTITLSDTGILTYQILPSAVVTEKTFMNIVFKIR
ncbi:hypothetical protein NZ698_16880 [Chryseobacterium sp. PBS4-4]|uniref:DUF4394 domain-containing protein n=1 Tax=Chryseobacterium edaphi TaxID=2976532 RepID=A0ABT2WC24_9FLAO|nr:hypothetical protein [Chryseobacterium edaphi]MCU7618857.1 hypothetical protein [Chryseobacterium edaphi]